MARNGEPAGDAADDEVPALIELWQHSPDHWAMVKAGHALKDIGTPEARAALRARIDDDEYICAYLGVRSLITNEGSAWDNMSWLFSEERLATVGLGAAWQALAQLFCDSGDGPESDLVSTDRRWLDLCVSLRDHPELAPVAREALRLADPAVTRPALDAAAEARKEQARRAPALVRGSLLGRYRRGEHLEVWDELAAVVPLSDAWRDEANQVAAVTMERVRDNAERLALALEDRGWPVPALSVADPDPDTEQHLEELERRLGLPVPPALAAFWRMTGNLSFVPDSDDGRSLVVLPDGIPGGLLYLDPLEAHGGGDLGYELENWLDEQEGAHPEAALLEFDICRDWPLKLGYSGSTYSVSLPFAGADPVVPDGRGLRFTDYLRRGFANKGFLADYTTLTCDDEEKATVADWLANVGFVPVEF